MTSPLEVLLDVQAHDTRLDQLNHQLATLPEQTARDRAAATLDATRRAVADETATRDELAKAQRRLDDEIETIGAKRQQVEGTLYDGSVTGPRELQDLQEEIQALSRRITHLEDQDLEIMEQLEPVEARLAELTATEAEAAAALETAEQELTAARAELAVQVDTEQEARDRVASSVPGPLLEQYEKLRTGLGGVGVARLVGSQCGGCHLALSAVEVARMRKLGPDEVTHCEECGRILVP